MAVRAEQRQVIETIVPPVAVDVFNFNRNFFSNRVPFSPPAATTPLTKRGVLGTCVRTWSSEERNNRRIQGVAIAS